MKFGMLMHIEPVQRIFGISKMAAAAVLKITKPRYLRNGSSDLIHLLVGVQ